MDIDKLFSEGGIDGIADNVFGVVNNSVSEVKDMQRKKVAENVQLVVEALKKIESDIRERFDSVGNAIEKRVITIKDGRNGIDGRDGKPGKDGKAGRDGAQGSKGADGRNGVDGADGADGVSVTNARIDFDGSLVISLSTGVEVNVGEVVAPELAEQIKIVSNGGGTSQYVLDTLASLQAQITALIPSQTGNSGKFLTTDGTVTSWTSNLNGTVGATTPAAGAFTTGTFSSTLAVTGITTVAAGTALLPAIVSTTGTADTGLWFPAADTIAASTAGAERMRIDSSGNVGIGTTTPSSFNGLNCKLAVNGGPVGLANTGAVSQYIWLASHFSGVASGLYTDSDAFPMLGTTTAHPYKFMTNATERMRIDSAGNVGIGLAANASGKLQVAAATDITLGIANATTITGAVTLEAINNARSVNIPMEFRATKFDFTGPTTSMSIATTGDVGIGTSSPGVNLDVVGTSGARVKYGAGNGLLISQASSGGSVDINNQANAALIFATNNTNQVYLTAAGRVGIGTGATVNYALEVSTDSAGKPGVGGLWTVVSDERIKSNIVPANLDRCYEIVKSVPLKYFGFAPGVYTDDQIQDKHNLGWIAQDVQKVFKNAVSVKPFTLKTDIPDGTEEYEEQDFTLESVEKTETSIQVINGKAVQVSKVVTSENQVMLFDTVDVVDEAGNAVMVDDKPLTYRMPRMITKTRPKVRHDVIEDCLDLNGAQMIAALYGAVQALMEKVEVLEGKLAAA